MSAHDAIEWGWRLLAYTAGGVCGFLAAALLHSAARDDRP